jgi:hypothetical protein
MVENKKVVKNGLNNKEWQQFADLVLKANVSQLDVMYREIIGEKKNRGL